MLPIFTVRGFHRTLRGVCTDDLWMLAFCWFSLLLVGCGSSPILLNVRVDAQEGYSASFPAKVTTRIGHDGPISFRIDSAKSAEGARFEAAWFGFPEPLGDEERKVLLAKVVRGLSSERGTLVVAKGPAKGSALEGLDLVFDRDDNRRGFHRVVYTSALSMLQISVVGPKGGAWEESVPEFWKSLTIRRDSRDSSQVPWQAWLHGCAHCR